MRWLLSLETRIVCSYVLDKAFGEVFSELNEARGRGADPDDGAVGDGLLQGDDARWKDHVLELLGRLQDVSCPVEPPWANVVAGKSTNDVHWQCFDVPKLSYGRVL